MRAPAPRGGPAPYTCARSTYVRPQHPHHVVRGLHVQHVPGLHALARAVRRRQDHIRRTPDHRYGYVDALERAGVSIACRSPSSRVPSSADSALSTPSSRL
jgi:hypothetical protein